MKEKMASIILPQYEVEKYLDVIKRSAYLESVEAIEVVIIGRKIAAEWSAIVEHVFQNETINKVVWSDCVLSEGDKTPIDELYMAIRDGLLKNNYCEKYERVFFNAALFDILQSLHNADTETEYWDIRAKIKYYIEGVFHFLDKPVTYYYNKAWIKEYVNLTQEKLDYSEIDNACKVTVVIPSLNSRPYIRECVESAMEQTLKEIEILCVDAGSTDGTIEVLREYETLDHRVKVVKSNKKSYGYQINLGIKAAKGEYLAILESDDYIAPTMYEELYNVAKENHIEVLKADFEIFTGGKGKHEFIHRKISKKYEQYDKVINPSEDLKVFENTNIPWSGLYEMDFLRRNGILMNESPGASYQDNGFWFQCLCQTSRLYYKSESYYRLRRDNPESSVYSRNKVFCICDEYDFIRDCLRKNSELETKYATLCARYRFSSYMWRYGRIAEEFKIEFLQRFAEDFRKIERDGELDRSLFSSLHWETLLKIIQDPTAYYYNESELTYEFIRCLPPERYPKILERWYQKETGRSLDLENPQTFNEKIQWLKLYDNTSLRSLLSDKYRVREWVKEKIGAQYLIPILGVWNKFDDIDFNLLPQQFVLKANHGSGWNVIVKNKDEVDFIEAKNNFDVWTKKNFAARGLQLQYADIVPKIIGEQYLENDNNELNDYKIYCFNGKANCVQYMADRQQTLKMAFYDLNWNKLHFLSRRSIETADVKKPSNLALLVSLAERLADGFSFVRVDFYVLNDGSIKFGEMTFTPHNGTSKWNPPEQNLVFGKMINLPTDKTPLPAKSLAEKGALPMLPAFPLGKSEVEVLKERANAAERRADSLKKKADGLKKKADGLKKELDKIKSSKAFRMSEKMAWPVRKLRKLLM